MRRDQRIAHCLERLHERYQLRTGPWIIERHERLIREQRSTDMGPLPHGSVHTIEDGGTLYYVAVSDNRQITTYLLPRQAMVMLAGRKPCANRESHVTMEDGG